MITLFIWCIFNGLIFHFDPNIMTEETKMIIDVICVASDLHLINSVCVAKNIADMRGKQND